MFTTLRRTAPLWLLLTALAGFGSALHAAAPSSPPATPPSTLADGYAADDDPTGSWEPPAVYLTWQRDPSATMTVHWHSWPDRPVSAVRYRPAGDDDAPWSTVTGTSRPMPATERRVHTVELTGLDPDTRYAFEPGRDAVDFHFRTLPDTPTRPIRFVVSGCIYDVYETYVGLADRLAARSPDFAVLNGDIAYADAELRKFFKWTRFLEGWKNHMVTPAGDLVPMLWTLGNHEVAGGYDQDPSAAPFFYNLIAFPQPGFGVIDVGDYLSIVLLDSAHTNPIDGVQKAWLEQTLKPRADVPHLFAAYHVPAYPSARGFGGEINQRVREHWVPLFEAHGVDVAFEAHDHAFKRTHPIRNGEIDEHGIVYMGDGGWATNGTRTPAGPGSPWSGGRWYLAESAAANHALLVTLDGDLRTFEPIDIHGNVLGGGPYRMTAGQPVSITLSAGTGFSPPIWAWLIALAILLVAGGAGYAVAKNKRQSPAA